MSTRKSRSKAAGAADSVQADGPAAAAPAPVRLTLPFMTKFEFNQIIALRTEHLSRGAPILVDLEGELTVKRNMELRAIAIRELKERVLPYIIKRPLPNGKSELWNVTDLDLTTVEHLMRA